MVTRGSVPLVRWITLPELPVQIGWNHGHTPQRMDLWVMDTWSSCRTIGHEIKVSRSDFFHEVRDNPDKAKAAQLLCDDFYYVVPKGLVGPAEVPEGCGLLYVGDKGRVTPSEMRRQRSSGHVVLPHKFVAMALRRAYMQGREDAQDH